MVNTSVQPWRKIPIGDSYASKKIQHYNVPLICKCESCIWYYLKDMPDKITSHFATFLMFSFLYHCWERFLVESHCIFLKGLQIRVFKSSFHGLRLFFRHILKFVLLIFFSQGLTFIVFTGNFAKSWFQKMLDWQNKCFTYQL